MIVANDETAWESCLTAREERDRLRRWGVGAGAVLLLGMLASLVWVHRVLIEAPDQRALLNSDTYRYFWPTTVFVHEQLLQGHLPLWNPYQMAGQPFLALHLPGIWYPPNLLLMGPFAPPDAVALHAVLHMLIAGFFCFLLARRMGLRATAGLAIGVVYMISGSLLTGIYLPPFLSVPAWLPAILWALTALLQEARWRHALWLALFVSLAFLGGHAQAFLYIMQVSLLFGVAGLFLLTRPGRRLRVLRLAGTAAVVAFGLAAPQILPSLEFISSAVRNFEGLSGHQASLPLVSPDGLLEGLLGAVQLPGPERGLGPDRHAVSLPPSALPLAALGLVTFVIAPLAARLRRTTVSGAGGEAQDPGERRAQTQEQGFFFCFFLASAVFAGLFVQGPFQPVFAFYYELPGGNLFRGPMRMSFLYVLSAGVLMGFGFDAVCGWVARMALSSPWPRLLSGGFASLLLLFIAANCYERTGLNLAHPLLEEEQSGAPDTMLEYLRATAGGERTFVQHGGLYDSRLLFKFGMMNELFVVPDYEPSMPGRYATFFGTDATPLWHGRLDILEAHGGIIYPVEPRLLDLMSVRYYALLGPNDSMGERIGAQIGDDQVVIGTASGTAAEPGVPWELFVRPESLPRAYVVSDVETGTDDAAVRTRLLEESFPIRDRAIVSEPERSGWSAFGDEPRSSSDTGSVEIRDYRASGVDLRAECLVPCLLVLTDLHYPGWVATVDGQEVPIHRTNVLFRGVRLDPGRHEVSFRFEPLAFRLGLGAFALTIVVLAGALLRQRFRRSPRSSRSSH